MITLLHAKSLRIRVSPYKIRLNKRGFFLFGVSLIGLTAIVVYEVRILNKDSLHMFSKTPI